MRACSYAEIAQLVEHLPEEQGVGGSIPSLSTFGLGSGKREPATLSGYPQ